MSEIVLPLTLLLAALIFALTAVFLIAQGRSFARNAVRTRARVVRFAPLGGQGRLVPVLEFTDEQGLPVKKTVQTIGRIGVRAGDTVEIMYVRRKVLGLDAWNIFIMRHDGAKPYRLHAVMGIILCALSLALAAAGLAALL